MVVLADFDLLVHRLIRVLLIFFVLLCCSEYFSPPPFSRRNKDQADGSNFAKARWARAIQKVGPALKTTHVMNLI